MRRRDNAAEALRAVVAEVEWPSEPDLAGAVTEVLRAQPLHGTRRRAPVRRLALAAAVIVALGAATLVVSPAARHAVARWLGVAGIRIESVPAPPSGELPGDLLAGEPVSLEEAQREAEWDVAVPRALGVPDGVFLDRSVTGHAITLAYDTGPDLPELADGVGLIVTQFQGRLEPDLIKKVAGPGSEVQVVEVDGETGLWISGSPHALLYVGPDGEVHEDRSRFAANTLVWQRAGVTYRIESELPLARTLGIAKSL